MEDGTVVVLVCVAGVTIVEACALVRGVDGTAVASAIVTIGVIASYYMRQRGMWYRHSIRKVIEKRRRM